MNVIQRLLVSQHHYPTTIKFPNLTARFATVINVDYIRKIQLSMNLLQHIIGTIDKSKLSNLLAIHRQLP